MTFVSLLAAALLCTGCARRAASSSYLAKVGSAALYEEDLGADSLGIARASSRAYVNEWVVSEMLYQEAQRRGLADSDQLRKQLEATRKRLAIDALLEREIYSDTSMNVTDEDIASSFKSNLALYTLRQDVARMSYALFSERDPANQFRSLVLRGTSWDDAISITRRDSINSRYLRAAARDQYFTEATLYPEELWKLARTLAKDELSYVVKTHAGYYVLAVHGIKRTGETPEFAFVKNEVRTRLLIERRRALYERLVAELRTRYRVELNPSATDTAHGVNE